MYSFCKPNKHQKQWIIFISPFLNSFYAAVDCKMLDCFEFCDSMQILLIVQPCEFASNISENLRDDWWVLWWACPWSWVFSFYLHKGFVLLAIPVPLRQICHAWNGVWEHLKFISVSLHSTLNHWVLSPPPQQKPCPRVTPLCQVWRAFIRRH